MACSQCKHFVVCLWTLFLFSSEVNDKIVSIVDKWAIFDLKVVKNSQLYFAYFGDDFAVFLQKIRRLVLNVSV